MSIGAALVVTFWFTLFAAFLAYIKAYRPARLFVWGIIATWLYEIVKHLFY